MFLLIDSGDNYYQVVKISRVDRNTSEGVVVRRIDKNGKEMYPGVYDKALGDYIDKPFPPLKKGIRVTTSPLLFDQ
jgi:hypothetical protein